jgi:hypothetical protein
MSTFDFHVTNEARQQLVHLMTEGKHDVRVLAASTILYIEALEQIAASLDSIAHAIPDAGLASKT